VRALVVAHDRRVLEHVGHVVSDQGFECTQCLDGQSAWDLIEAGEIFDLMVAQMMLPWKDGWELSQIRESGGFLANVLLTQQWHMITDFEQFGQVRFSALPVNEWHLIMQIAKAIQLTGE